MNDMVAFYPQVREMHIAAAMLSGSLFALRGACALAGMRWPRTAPVRYSGYVIDTTLLTTALMLVTILPSTMFANGWLTAKLSFVAAYVALGIATMRARRHGVRAACYVAALAAFVLVVGIARAHQPLGWFVRWFA